MSRFFRGLYGYVRGLDWRKWHGLKVSVMTWFRLVEVEGWRRKAPALPYGAYERNSALLFLSYVAVLLEYKKNYTLYLGTDAVHSHTEQCYALSSMA